MYFSVQWTVAMQINIKAHGPLHSKVPQSTYELPSPSRVGDLLERLGLQDGGVWMVVVNGSMAENTSELHEGDRVELVYPLAGG